MDMSKTMKAIVAYVSYFLCSVLATTITQSFQIKNGLIVSFLFDLVFLIGIIYAYRDNLKKDIRKLKAKQEKSKFYIVKTILCWVAIIFVFNIVMGMLTELIFPTTDLDANTSAMFALKEESMFYAIFKSMIFAIVAEEILFRESISDIISNKALFVVISAIVYTFMNFAFSGFESSNIILNILTYFLPALLFSTAYVKNDSNIIVLMLIKFAYNLIPLTIMLLGL